MKRTFLQNMNHLLLSQKHLHRTFSKAAFEHIEKAIKESESRHSGQVLFIVEAALPTHLLLQQQSPRDRALDLFSKFKVWDTQDNNGVLIYLLLADKDIEIIADRGIHNRSGAAFWQSVCQEMEVLLKHGRFEEGILLGIKRIDHILTQEFPISRPVLNEIPDQIIII